MEWVLDNTDIFDVEIDAKFNQLIQANKDNFIGGNVYTFTVSFDVNLLNDVRFEEFNIPVPERTSIDTKKDKINNVLSFQLDKLIQVLIENDIEVRSTKIQGDVIEAENIIKIEINEDTSEPNLTSKGKKSKRGINKYKISSIIPNLPKTQELMQYTISISLLKQILAEDLITKEEFIKCKDGLKKRYNIKKDNFHYIRGGLVEKTKI